MFVSSDFSFVKFDGRRKAKSVTVQSGCGVYRLGVRTNLAYHHDDPGSNGLATTQNGKYRGSISKVDTSVLKYTRAVKFIVLRNINP